MAKQKKAPRTFLQYILQEHLLGLGLIVIIALCGVSYFELRHFCISRTYASYFCAYAGLQPAHQINQTNQTNVGIAPMQQYINLYNTTSQNISITVAPYIVKLTLTRSNPITTANTIRYQPTATWALHAVILYSNCTITNATIIAPDGSSGIVNQTYAYSLLKINGYISSSGECSYSGG